MVDHVGIIVPVPKQRPDREGEENEREKGGEEKEREKKERIEDSGMLLWLAKRLHISCPRANHPCPSKHHNQKNCAQSYKFDRYFYTLFLFIWWQSIKRFTPLSIKSLSAGAELMAISISAEAAETVQN